MKNHVSNGIGCALVATFVVLVILAIASVDGGLDQTSPWLYYLVGASSAIIGSAWGTSE